MAQFKPGESGNPNGRPRGSKNKVLTLREALATLDRTPETLFVEAWRLAIDERDARAAATLARAMVEYCFPKPSPDSDTEQRTGGVLLVTPAPESIQAWQEKYGAMARGEAQ